ncbi:hypothetical protein [Streptomyces celluloflavus]|uniref:hypothetical protein n=1 Tax=Streptomyces celluloflavus TaxID=58344 RepID=UPI0036D1A1B3
MTDTTGPALPDAPPTAPDTHRGPAWGERIRAARQDRARTAAVYEQTLRDAHRFGDRTIRQIAADIGVRDRTAITKIVQAPPGAPVTAPTLPTVIYVTGRWFPAAWEELHASMNARGWYTTRHPQNAWHLSRAGATTVHLTLHPGQTTVALMRAVHAQPATEPTYAVKELLSTAAAIALEEAHPDAAEFRVSVPTVETEWKTLRLRTYPRPERTWPDQIGTPGLRGAAGLDPQPVMRWIAEILE